MFDLDFIFTLLIIGFCLFMAGSGQTGGGGSRPNSGIIGRKYEYKGISRVVRKIIDKRKFH